ncbi:unnamed protein product [Symbiodinium natans]|uniref:Uncharacterized protein n=1 Tax=Symbiodinium natans TaxID=878477 RepID=A0A812RHS6_9DINO|nr:unnamed protein product [Symbiodinium natans]
MLGQRNSAPQPALLRSNPGFFQKHLRFVTMGRPDLDAMTIEELKAYLESLRQKRRQQEQKQRQIFQRVLQSWVSDAADYWTWGWYSFCCAPADHVRDDDVVV